MSHVAAERALHAAVRRRRTIRSARADCRLTIFINGTHYQVNRNAAEADAALRAYRLTKADGTTYDVAQTDHGPTCDCPDWVFRRDGFDPDGCKHIKAMMAYGLLD